jgi:hypothetical protein
MILGELDYWRSPVEELGPISSNSSNSSTIETIRLLYDKRLDNKGGMRYIY